MKARIAAGLQKSGSPTRARTWDLRINSPSLYQLSYQGIEGYSSRRRRFGSIRLPLFPRGHGVLAMLKMCLLFD